MQTVPRQRADSRDSLAGHSELAATLDEQPSSRPETPATRREPTAAPRADLPTDGLTGLVTRVGAVRFLREALDRYAAQASGSSDRTVAVLFCDIDRFKIINDSFGRDAGDELLTVVARRLEHTVALEYGDGCVVGRVAADEFLVICDEFAGPDAAMALAGRIHAALGQAVSLGDDRVKVRVSIGVAITTSADSGAEQLIQHAETASMRAKAQGRDRIETFDASMRARAQRRLRFELDLAGACHRGEIALHYQPILHLHEGRVTGLEALARWYHPERDLVPPAEFIPIAEETGLIRQIGEWAMEEAWKQSVRWNRVGANIRVGVNVSARELAQDGFVDSVAALIGRLGPQVAPHIEITESVLMIDPQRGAAMLSELRELGVRFSLDDFGTGYSSLAYLQNIPVDILKIDRSFIIDIDTDDRKRALVKSMVDLGHAIDLLVLAEGVETAAQRTVIEDIGFDLIQGFLIARPAPPDTLDPATFL